MFLIKCSLEIWNFFVKIVLWVSNFDLSVPFQLLSPISCWFEVLISFIYYIFEWLSFLVSIRLLALKFTLESFFFFMIKFFRILECIDHGSFLLYQEIYFLIPFEFSLLLPDTVDGLVKSWVVFRLIVTGGLRQDFRSFYTPILSQLSFIFLFVHLLLNHLFQVNDLEKDWFGDLDIGFLEVEKF